MFLIVVERGITEDVRAEFFALRLWGYSGQPCNNQQNYGKMGVAAGFSRSERSRNNLGRNYSYSGRMLYGRETGSGWSKSHCTWLLPFYIYPANCLVSDLLRSMVFSATVCQVYVSRSVGTEVIVAVQTPIGHENSFAIGTLPTWSMTLWVKKGNVNRLDWLHCWFLHVLSGVLGNGTPRCLVVSWCCAASIPHFDVSGRYTLPFTCTNCQ